MNTYWQMVLDHFYQVPWVHLMVSLQWFFMAYFVAINLAYLVLNYISAYQIVRYMREHRANYLPEALREYQPPVSVLLPAHNEEKSVVSSVRSLLKTCYPDYEIVVINDGSTDGTREALIQAFGLVMVPEAYRARLKTEAVKGVYASPTHPRVRMVDKANGGKADAINAGINCARYPLFCVMDADSILQPESLSRVVRPFLEDRRVVASGGVVRVLNGCTVSDGQLSRIGLPDRWLPSFQLVEYLRAFLFGRVGWSPMNALLIISGAFGVFYKERVVAVGGYRADTVGEDMDLVVRMHRSLRREGRDYRIVFVPDPVCWTEVPADLKSLRSQRMRWQYGLAESLWSNLSLMFNRRGGVVGWIAFPFMLLFEFFGPAIEVIGYVAMISLAILGLVPLDVFLVFLVAAVGMGVLLSVNAMLLEELSFGLYARPRQQLRLFVVAVLENFGYRQINSLWRLAGTVNWLLRPRKRHGWGRIQRDGSWQQLPEDDLPPAAVPAGPLRPDRGGPTP
ncbi:glycosyltransferase [Stenotrophomonas acidaminiphila]|uniref:glycosyltransferase family 2 protein n=1 Tax=Stenotrophomonas acidaminiphila TaxID=128780 RepID=UPI000CDBF16E|nr:glycosyltransferase [Stenotrophomonas acidaminiphila]AUZ56172.1 glycosyl transferase [Stenotrophomonas acidaminiphila]WPU55777.1 glycosyltransferase [Stenotrophomonas acidaminiphila]